MVEASSTEPAQGGDRLGRLRKLLLKKRALLFQRKEQQAQAAVKSDSVFKHSKASMMEATGELDRIMKSTYASVKRVSEVAKTLDQRHAIAQAQAKIEEARITREDMKNKLQKQALKKALSPAIKHRITAIAKEAKQMRELFESKTEGYAGLGGAMAVRVAAQAERLAMDVRRSTGSHTDVPPKVLAEPTPGYITGASYHPPVAPVEARGEKDMGSYKIRAYTPAQQARLHVDALGRQQENKENALNTSNSSAAHRAGRRCMQGCGRRRLNCNARFITR